MNDPTGDLSAAQLFREHGAFVARILYRMGVPPQAIDDAVQDVFLVVHQRGGYRPGPAKPTTYLALIASRAASAQRRQLRLRAARQGSTEPEEIHAQDEDPALHVERRDDLHRLQDALSRLDPTLRDTLVLAEFQDETAPAIADAMGVSVGTVYWRLHEARKKFQRALAVADGSRARSAAERAPSRAGRALSRGAKLAALLGLLHWSEARALFEAARDARCEFDLERALARHLERVAALPPSPAALQAATKVGAGMLKIAAWSGVAALGTLAALRALYGAPAHEAERARAASSEALTGAQEREHASTTGVRAAAAQEPRASTREALRDAEDRPRASPSDALASGAHRAQTSARDELAADRLQAARAASAPPASPAAGTGAAYGHGAEASNAARSRARRPSLPEPPNADSASESPSPGSPDAPAANPPAPARDEPAREDAQPAKRPAAHDPMLEARALARAHQMLATQPARALAIVEGLPTTPQYAYLSEERSYIQVMALYAVERRAEANRAADRFLQRYPASVFRERVSAARKSSP